MCGIAGILDKTQGSSSVDIMKGMLELLYHRGPDAYGIFQRGPVCLGHSRLSIVDLATGDQPISNEDDSVWVVFNGEIFNYPELRQECLEKGHKLKTQGDTEVLIHLYEEYGEAMLEKLNGQFAFAIWDHPKEKLFIARDRLGIRPLFYTQHQNGIIFGSEVKAIFGHPEVSRELNLNGLSNVFNCWTSLPDESAFKNVKQLPAGHYLVAEKGLLQIRKYWNLPFGEYETENKSLEEWSSELLEALLDSIRIRLRADVPVGAYLSGGIDSTLISSLVKNNFNNELQTFSVGFSNKTFDESNFQQTAVRALGTKHHEIKCTDEDIGKIFPQIIWHTEMPIIRTAPAPLFMLSSLVRKNNFKVVLTGEGADEMFGGYNIFKENKVRHFWSREPESPSRARLLEKLYPYVFAQQDGKASVLLKKFFQKNLSDTQNPYYSHSVRWQNTSQLRSFFNPEVFKSTPSLNDFQEKYASWIPENFSQRRPLAKAQFLESQLFLSNYLLSSQGDRMAMGNSVEGRYPFLDHRVVELAAKIPDKYKLYGLTEKYILKHLSRKLIPSEVIDRPKQPYRAPISSSFFGGKSPDYVEELLSEEKIGQSGVFHPKKVAQLAQKCRQSEAGLSSERENMALVAILSVQLCHSQFVENFPVKYGNHNQNSFKIFH